MSDELWALSLSHLRLTLIAVSAASVLGFGLGVLALRSRMLERVAMSAAALVQTVPALALLAVMVPTLAWIGRHTGLPISGIGELPALIGLTLYAVLPIARGVTLGVRGIDPAVRAAALAVGMHAGQRLRLIELPLAAPMIVGGIRTATAWTVGMATLATPVGAASLGNLIFGGLQTRHYDLVAQGCVASAAMALVADQIFAWGERRVRSARGLGVLGAAMLACTAVVWLSGLQPSAAGRIRVGAKSFSEQLILAEVLRCALAPLGDVEVRASLGSTVAFDALRQNELDVYVEYTGTAWTTLLHEHATLERASMRRAVERELVARYGVHVVAQLGFENAYALVVRADAVERSIGDLARSHDRVFAADYEFFERPEWAALRDRYGLRPRARRVMDPSLLYSALAERAVDVIAGYTTDGRIDAMHLRMLADDAGAIPPYDAIVIVSPRMWRQRPAAIEQLRKLDGSIDVERMRAWNADVDSGTSPRAVAAKHEACRH